MIDLSPRQKQALARDKNIELIFAEHSVKGKVIGIDEQGALLLENEMGVKAYHMGEVSLRPLEKS